MEQETKVKIEQAMELADKFEKGYEAGVYATKNKILRWAKQKQYESLTIVADNFWQEVIDKLNSM